MADHASRRDSLIGRMNLGQKLTDDAVTMFIKLMSRLFSQANNRKKQRHVGGWPHACCNRCTHPM
ncbi:hypothetical protein FJ946_20295 [Mesorhizobium sp. B2-4-7]|nr:hypothetical protein FJW11_25745 [Mesorhizobium sp. B3-1-1]TPJ40944.1 hypothetical protein FJ437_24935 [Mesorhizobium sp. B2-6-6]TPJ58942.1 hypothetical protein FJ443_25020 [Mesorhizobium sp. B2-6-1]TPJ63177.1 hypothetical protein FJ462_23965 [Mesorhizobium sp. B2-6-7]TPJ79573.1 hypothetical protein FJ422_24765 [Mesorhizobium sp. B2-6-3]TPJ93770.1 hypothetical protein FJ489_20995 [Mesorhizobium sp. B2-5-12]TPJ94249.1 hypothetical protein FJ491_26400 [Mesorhizobium sp. B2-5-10]TPK06588.1 h